MLLFRCRGGIFGGGQVSPHLLTESVLVGSGLPVTLSATLGNAPIAAATKSLIRPLQCHSIGTVNERPESLPSSAPLSWRRSSPAPPLLRRYFPSSFIPQPTVCWRRGSSFSSGEESPPGRAKGSQRAQAGPDPPTQATAPPLQGPSARRPSGPRVPAQVEISREPSATKRSITFEWGLFEMHSAPPAPPGEHVFLLLSPPVGWVTLNRL